MWKNVAENSQEAWCWPFLLHLSPLLPELKPKGNWALVYIRVAYLLVLRAGRAQGQRPAPGLQTYRRHLGPTSASSGPSVARSGRGHVCVCSCSAWGGRAGLMQSFWFPGAERKMQAFTRPQLEITKASCPAQACWKWEP